MKYPLALACLAFASLPALVHAADAPPAPACAPQCPPCPVCAVPAPPPPPAPPTEPRSLGQVGAGFGLTVLGLAGIAGGITLGILGEVSTSTCETGNTGPHPGLVALGIVVGGGALASVVTGVWLMAHGGVRVPVKPAPGRAANARPTPTFDPTTLTVRF